MKINVASRMEDKQFSFIVPHTGHITGLASRVTRRVPHVEQGRLTLPGQVSSHPVLSRVRVARSLVFCVMF